MRLHMPRIMMYQLRCRKSYWRLQMMIRTSSCRGAECCKRNHIICFCSGASHVKAEGPRAGEVFAAGPLVLPGVDSINATALGEDMFALNHDVYSSARSAIGDISRIIATSIRPPNVRSTEIRPVPEGSDHPRYWRFPPQ